VVDMIMDDREAGIEIPLQRVPVLELGAWRVFIFCFHRENG
jgi:hypothetical protein